ncbi:MAG: right-handed parallel beta-helix repeat-containing protein, partial [Fimbriimonadales bacterium]
MQLYVAPNGDDRWSGTRPTPNRTRTDGPLASLPRALQRVAERKTSSATIFLRGGTYWLTEPIVLTPEHSHLTIQAYRDEKPILSGGIPLSGWHETTLDGKRVWALTLPAGLPIPFRQLFVNGKRA